MKRILTLLITATVVASCNTKTETKMNTTEIFPKGQQLPNDWFVGNAFITPLVAKDKNNEFSAGSVTFEAGARTNWHTHPKGQVLIVIDGNGFYQRKRKTRTTN